MRFSLGCFRMLIILAIGSGIVACPLGAVAQPVLPEPDFEQIKRRGAATLDRLKKESAAWTAAHETPRGETQLEFLYAPDKRRMTFYAFDGQKRTEMVQIIERDNLWHVAQFGELAKYRPYEAPFLLPTLY